MSYSRTNLESDSKRLQKSRIRQERLERQVDCENKYYSNKNNQFYKCRNGFFAYFRNENEMEKCEEKVYKAFQGCVKGKW